MSKPTPDATALDKHGRAFDPRKFFQRFDRLGRWINKKTGRKAKTKPPTMTTQEALYHETTPATPSPATEPAAETPAPATPAPATAPAAEASRPAESAPDLSDIVRAANGEAPAAAEVENGDPAEAAALRKLAENPTTETIIGALQTALVLIGQDEGILSETEKILLRIPLKRVLDKYGVGDKALPAEIDLAFALAGILIARLSKPKTATFFAKVRHWFVSKWFSRQGAALARKVEAVNPHPAAA